MGGWTMAMLSQWSLSRNNWGWTVLPLLFTAKVFLLFSPLCNIPLNCIIFHWISIPPLTYPFPHYRDIMKKILCKFLCMLLCTYSASCMFTLYNNRVSTLCPFKCYHFNFSQSTVVQWQPHVVVITNNV
jgi:hypothetical protein